LPRAENVSIIIYNLIGQRVKTLISQNQTAGNYSVIWDATDDTGQKLGSGLYFYVLQAGEYRAVKKMMLLK
jgi:flagellar hook assembly protein FlgD